MSEEKTTFQIHHEKLRLEQRAKQRAFEVIRIFSHRMTLEEMLAKMYLDAVNDCKGAQKEYEFKPLDLETAQFLIDKHQDSIGDV